MAKRLAKARETRVGFTPAKKPGRAPKARTAGKTRRVSTALVDRLIATAKAMAEGRAKTVRLTGLPRKEALALLTGPVRPGKNDD